MRPNDPVPGPHLDGLLGGPCLRGITRVRLGDRNEQLSRVEVQEDCLRDMAARTTERRRLPSVKTLIPENTWRLPSSPPGDPRPRTPPQCFMPTLAIGKRDTGCRQEADPAPSSL